MAERDLVLERLQAELLKALDSAEESRRTGALETERAWYSKASDLAERLALRAKAIAHG